MLQEIEFYFFSVCFPLSVFLVAIVFNLFSDHPFFWKLMISFYAVLFVSLAIVLYT